MSLDKMMNHMKEVVENAEKEKLDRITNISVQVIPLMNDKELTKLMELVQDSLKRIKLERQDD